MQLITIPALTNLARALAGRPVPDDNRALAAAAMKWAWHYSRGWTSTAFADWRHDKPRIEDTARGLVRYYLDSARSSAGNWPGHVDDIVAFVVDTWTKESPLGRPLTRVDPADVNAFAVVLQARAAVIWAEISEATAAPPPAPCAVDAPPSTSRLELAEAWREPLAALGCEAGPIVTRTATRDAAAGTITTKALPGLVVIADPATTGDIGPAVLAAAGLAARDVVAVRFDLAALLAALHRIGGIDEELLVAVAGLGSRPLPTAAVLVLADEGGALYQWGRPLQLMIERPLVDSPETRARIARRLADLRASGATRAQLEAAHRAGA